MWNTSIFLIPPVSNFGRNRYLAQTIASKFYYGFLDPKKGLLWPKWLKKGLLMWKSKISVCLSVCLCLSDFLYYCCQSAAVPAVLPSIITTTIRTTNNNNNNWLHGKKGVGGADCNFMAIAAFIGKFYDVLMNLGQSIAYTHLKNLTSLHFRSSLVLKVSNIE